MARKRTSIREARDRQATLDERLSEARSSDVTELDLTGLDLDALPDEIFRLTHLTSLSLSGGRISSLPPEVGKLKNLHRLYLADMPLTELPNSVFSLPNLQHLWITNTKISKIPSSIGNLKELRRLDATGSPIESLPDEIGELKNLDTIWFQFCNLRGLPKSLSNCKKLDTLELDDCPLYHFPDEIGLLLNLNFLSMDRTGLEEIPDIFSNLVKLNSLFLAGNKIRKLPPSMKSLQSLEKLDLNNNFLQIPPEILQSNPVNILNFYFSSVESPDPKISLNEAKMVVVGQGGVGKTSLVKRLLGQPYDPNEDTTRGIWICPWGVDPNEDGLKINIWDFGGQEIMHATHQFFLTKRTLYLLVLDSRQGEQESRLEYWLKIIQSFGGTSPIIVVCNKADRSRLALDETGLRRKYASIVGFATNISCQTGEGVDELRKLALAEIRKLDHLHDLFLTSWIAVKDELDSMRDSQYEYISYEEYERVCTKNGVDDKMSRETLVSFLHDLGVILRFPDPNLEATNILSPGWVTAGVYRILTWHLEGGILEFDQLKTILDAAKYPSQQHLFIIGMMEKFELCFKFEPFANRTYLIPDLLPKNEPDTGDWASALNFQYHYEVLPSSVISRFIVRMNHYISNRTYWRNGVVIAKGGNRALIKADLEDRKVFVSVSGRQSSRRLLMDIIRSEFERIHTTIPQLAVQEKVPMPDDLAILADYNHLLTLLELGEGSFVPEGSKTRYSVRELLEGIETDQRRAERRDEQLDPRERRGRTAPLTPASENGPTLPLWKAGAFFLTTLMLCVVLFGASAYALGGLAAASVAIAAIVAVCLIGVLVLRATNLLSERNTVTLAQKALGSLRLLKAGKQAAKG